MNLSDKGHAWDEIWNALCDGNVVALNRFNPNIGQALLEVRRLNISDAAVKKLHGIGYARELFTDADLAILKILVSTAVWIRSEQLCSVNEVIVIKDPCSTTVLDTHDLALKRLRSELDAGRALWSKLSDYCDDHAIPAPEWPT